MKGLFSMPKVHQPSIQNGGSDQNAFDNLGFLSNKTWHLMSAESCLLSVNEVYNNISLFE